MIRKIVKIDEENVMAVGFVLMLCHEGSFAVN